MADYAIGDVQGCYDALQRLLDLIQFDEKQDRLWFVGDLVNRGSQSLLVLQFIKKLPIPAHITLGNHDLHLLNRIFINRNIHYIHDNLQNIVEHSEAEEIGHWLRQQPLLYHNENFKIIMVHAGIAPMWNLSLAKLLATEVTTALQGENFYHFLQHIYGELPSSWSNKLTGYARLRLITNYFTRMRFCYSDGGLNFTYKGTVAAKPTDLTPWFSVPKRIDLAEDLIFGHWSALKGHTGNPKFFALDTGCIWGGALTALRIQDKKYFRINNKKYIDDNK